MFIQHLHVKVCIFLPEVAKIFSQINISVVLQSQIIQKHLHVDYNPLKGMLVLISSLKW